MRMVTTRKDEKAKFLREKQKMVRSRVFADFGTKGADVGISVFGSANGFRD